MSKAAAAAPQDRLATLAAVRDAGVSVCAGGIIGLGEGEKDRVGLIHQVTAGAQDACATPRTTGRFALRQEPVSVSLLSRSGCIDEVCVLHAAGDAARAPGERAHQCPGGCGGHTP